MDDKEAKGGEGIRVRFTHMPSASDFFGSLIFGAIGLGALLYGKSVGSVVKMSLGAAILGCSYLVTESWLLWTSGGVLTLLLMKWKE